MPVITFQNKYAGTHREQISIAKITIDCEIIALICSKSDGTPGDVDSIIEKNILKKNNFSIIIYICRSIPGFCCKIQGIRQILCSLYIRIISSSRTAKYSGNDKQNKNSNQHPRHEYSRHDPTGLPADLQ